MPVLFHVQQLQKSLEDDLEWKVMLNLLNGLDDQRNFGFDAFIVSLLVQSL